VPESFDMIYVEDRNGSPVIVYNYWNRIETHDVITGDIRIIYNNVRDKNKIKRADEKTVNEWIKNHGRDE
jgi:hypothetical protein